MNPSKLQYAKYCCRQLYAKYYGNSIEEKKHKNMQSSIDVLFTPPKGMTNKHIRTRIPHAMMLFPSVPFPFHGVSLKNQEELTQSEMVPEQSELIHRAQRHLRTVGASVGCGLLDRSFINVSGICAFLIGGRIALTHLRCLLN